MTIIDHKDGLPIYAPRASELLEALFRQTIELPCWVKTGRSSHRITRESAGAIARGLLIAAELLEGPATEEDYQQYLIEQKNLESKRAKRNGATE